MSPKNLLGYELSSNYLKILFKGKIASSSDKLKTKSFRLFGSNGKIKVTGAKIIDSSLILEIKSGKEGIGKNIRFVYNSKKSKGSELKFGKNSQQLKSFKSRLKELDGNNSILSDKNLDGIYTQASFGGLSSSPVKTANNDKNGVANIKDYLIESGENYADGMRFKRDTEIVSKNRLDYILPKSEIKGPLFTKPDFQSVDREIIGEKYGFGKAIFEDNSTEDIPSKSIEILDGLKKNALKRNLSGVFGDTGSLNAKTLLPYNMTQIEKYIDENIIISNQNRYKDTLQRLQLEKKFNPGLITFADYIQNTATAESEEFSWRNWNVVPEVKDQKTKGYCWAFATLGALESNYKIRNGYLPDLSESQFADLAHHPSTRSGTILGIGKDIKDAFNFDPEEGGFGWIELSDFVLEDGENYRGITTEAVVPYNDERDPRDDTKRLSPRSYGASSWGFVGDTGLTPSTVDEVKEALIEHGPIVTSMYVTDSFKAYSGGLYYDSLEGETWSDWDWEAEVDLDTGVDMIDNFINWLGNGAIDVVNNVQDRLTQIPSWLTNHMVQITGWSDELNAWEVKNSWGRTWGHNGYAWVSYDQPNFGIYDFWVESPVERFRDQYNYSVAGDIGTLNNDEQTGYGANQVIDGTDPYASSDDYPYANTYNNPHSLYEPSNEYDERDELTGTRANDLFVLGRTGRSDIIEGISEDNNGNYFYGQLDRDGNLIRAQDVLGDDLQYYLDFPKSSEKSFSSFGGLRNYAVLRHVNPVKDRIQLSGERDDYLIIEHPGTKGMSISIYSEIYNDQVNLGKIDHDDDLIARVNFSSLSANTTTSNQITNALRDESYLQFV